MTVERLEDRTLPSLTFATVLTLSTGRFPGSVVIGDVNNGGIPDLVVNNALDNTVGVFLGTGGGKFGSEVNYSAGPNSVPAQVVLGDFGNGHLDIAVADAGRFGGGNQVSILLGNGDGTFQSPVSYTVGTGPGRVVAVDLTGNHILDLVVSNEFSNSVSVLMGNGNGTFQPAVNYSVGVNPLEIGVGDFNNDGTPDIAVANYGSNSVSILLGTGGGVFAPAVNFSAGTNPYGLAVGDFNGDGKPDLAATDFGSNSVSLLTGNGDGTFQAPSNFAVGTTPTGIAAADLNKDGKADLVVSNFGSSSVSVLLGNGNGSFAAPQNIPVGANPGLLAIADLDGDGTPDLAVPNEGSNSITVLLQETPQQEIQLIKNQVNGLSTASILNDGQANALDSKLDAAIASLDRGNTTAAINQLNAFINQVNAFLKAGILTSSQAQALISAANQVIAAIDGSGAHLMNENSAGAAGTADTQPVSDAGQLVTGMIGVYLVNADGTPVLADEQARFDDAISSLDATFASYGVDLVDVGASNAASAIIEVDIAATSPAGSAADGVLGCTVAGQITLLTGWNWFTGADSTIIGLDQYDFETIVMHELGHAIGLGHSGDTGSVMYAYLAPGQSRRAVTTQDMSVLESATTTTPEPLLAAPWRDRQTAAPPVVTAATDGRPALAAPRPRQPGPTDLTAHLAMSGTAFGEAIKPPATFFVLGSEQSFLVSRTGEAMPASRQSGLTQEPTDSANVIVTQPGPSGLWLSTGANNGADEPDAAMETNRLSLPDRPPATTDSTPQQKTEFQEREDLNLDHAIDDFRAATLNSPDAASCLPEDRVDRVEPSAALVFGGPEFDAHWALAASLALVLGTAVPERRARRQGESAWDLELGFPSGERA